MNRNYDAFQTQCFTAGIPNELLVTVRPWVETHYTVERFEDEKIWPQSDCGYAELADITTLDQAFKRIKTAIHMATVDETAAKTSRRYRAYCKDAGGRVGKGVYRLILKAYYLSGE